MSNRNVPSPTGYINFGMHQCDVTPPVGIYHRFWGAAKHDIATGVHRPLTATALAFSDNDGQGRVVVIAVDHCIFRPADMREILSRVSELAAVPEHELVVQMAHTHSGGHIVTDRADQPGGDLIRPYLDQMIDRIADAIRRAVDGSQPCVLTFGESTCSMGHQRDDWDESIGRHVCGFQPDGETNFPVKVVRISQVESESDEPDTSRLVMTLVNYPCHPTTLAWDNTLISPDYVGAMRSTIEDATAAPCAFLLAPCGDIGPKHGFVGDTAVADKNGRQLAYAALSASESAPPAGCDFHYAGAVISGATLGAWEFRPQTEARRAAAANFRVRSWKLPLPYLAGQPTVDDAQAEIAKLAEVETEQRTAGQIERAADTRAIIERRRRLIERIRTLPAGDAYPYPMVAWKTGDLLWLAVEGEPYYELQRMVSAAFPDHSVIVMPLANGSESSYLPPKDRYGKSLYQAEIAVLDAGALESVAASAIQQFRDWVGA